MIRDNLPIPAVAFVLGVEEFVIDVDIAMRVGGRLHAAHDPAVIKSLLRVPVCTFIKDVLVFIINHNQPFLVSSASVYHKVTGMFC
jgi:hypothetical protein